MSSVARYFNFKEMETVLKTWETEFPSQFEARVIGKSFEGRPIYVLVLTDRLTGPDFDKPAFWADANIHSTEVAGTTAVLTLAERLLVGFSKGEKRMLRLLKEHTFYLVPRLNPDGAERALSSSPEFLRSGVRNYPFEDLDSGLHIEDINQDGKILQMRMEDPSGDWKQSSLHPQLLEKRAPYEHGEKYYRLFSEGIVRDFDGHIVKVARPRAGLDLNRNFPFSWRTEGNQKGAGTFPASEPEVRAMVEFVTSHPNISVGICYHTYGGLLLRPYDDRPDSEMHTQDVWVYDRLGRRGAEVTGYDQGPVGELLKYHPKEVITGTGSEWLYDHLGIFAWTVEIWNVIKRAGVTYEKVMEWYRDHPGSEDAKILAWLAKNTKGPVFHEWRKFKHPQLGDVEIGGWDLLFTWRNPPQEWIAEEAAKNADWALELADTLPRLSFKKFEVESLGAGQHKVFALVENSGFLPTHTSQQAKKTKVVRPVRAEIILPPGAELVGGERLVERDHLEGRSNKLEVSGFSTPSSPTDNLMKLEWVVKAKPGTLIKVVVRSERGGTISREGLTKLG